MYSGVQDTPCVNVWAETTSTIVYASIACVQSVIQCNIA